MAKGLTFKGIHSDTFGLVMKSTNRQVLADVSRSIKSVPLLAGVVDFGVDTYTEKTIQVIMQFKYLHNITLLQSTAEDIGGWLHNDGTQYDLTFDDYPDRKFKAKVTKSVNLSQDGVLAVFGVEFTCNPPYPFRLDNTPVSSADVAERLLWDTAILTGTSYFQNFNADGDFQFTVSGNYPVKPIIRLLGDIRSGLELTYDDGTTIFYWQYDSDLAFDEIIIDCDAETVLRGSNGANLYSNVDAIKNTYFEVKIGQQKISIAGVFGAFPNNINMFVEFVPII